MHVYISIYAVHTHISLSIYTSMHIYIYIYMYDCMYLYIYINIYACMYARAALYKYVYI